MVFARMSALHVVHVTHTTRSLTTHSRKQMIWHEKVDALYQATNDLPGEDLAVERLMTEVLSDSEQEDGESYAEKSSSGEGKKEDEGDSTTPPVTDDEDV